LTTHLFQADIGRLMRGTLSCAARRRLVAHLISGCAHCSRALAVQMGLGRSTLAPEDYDAIVRRAGERAVAATAARREAIAMLTSLLAGERRWTDLSSADTARLRGVPRLHALLEAGRALGHDDAQAALRFAKLARCAADRLRRKDYGAEPVADLRALAWAELANAYRICDDLPQAHQAINRAIYFSHRGSGNVLLLARIADFLASLLGHQRRFGEALDLLDLVYKVHAGEERHRLAGRALIKAGVYAGYDGDPGRAILLMRRGLDLLDPGTDARLIAQTLQNMIWLLVDVGDVRHARRLLWRARILLVERGSRLDLLRLRWLEGRIHAGMADLRRAEEAFRETRAGFTEAGQVYPAALAGLDLAALWAREGRVSEIWALADEMIATFRALRIGREAIAVLLVLQKSCSSGGPLLHVIELAVSFLEKLDRQPVASAKTP
jgi:hypothetical protein